MNPTYNFYIYTKKPVRRIAVIALIWAIHTEKKIKSMRDRMDILAKEVEMLKEDREE